MKENRKLLKEVLEDIRHDMTDEEVLSLLAGRQFSVKPRRIPLQNSPEAGHLSFPLREFLCFG